MRTRNTIAMILALVLVVMAIAPTTFANGNTADPSAAPQEPDITEAPATEAPEPTDAPTETEIPTDTPDDTQEPTTTDEPSTEPVDSSEPEIIPDQTYDDNSRIVMGEDLTAQQRKEIYEYFGVNEGDVKELIMTNEEERELFEGLLPDEKLGNVSRSCIYITMLEEGSGLSVSTNNINWCTDLIYMGVLVTVGITDADVKITAPYALSGTAAVAGIYKAYEDITGNTLSGAAKLAGVQELLTTGDLAEMLGSEDATKLINELKKILNNIKDMSDDDVRSEIRRIATENHINLTDAQVEEVLKLCRKLQDLDIDKLQARLEEFLDNAGEKENTDGFFAQVWEKIRAIFTSIANFFKRLFS